MVPGTAPGQQPWKPRRAEFPALLPSALSPQEDVGVGTWTQLLAGQTQLCGEVAWPSRGWGGLGAPRDPGWGLQPLTPWITVAVREGVWDNEIDF